MDIAIIGVAGRFPEAANIEEFFSNLAMGKDSIRAVSPKRKRDTTIPLDTEYQTMGYMEDIDKFDHQFFGISMAEAMQMDPHQRLLMEVVYEAIESAGYNVDHFSGTATALFVACPELKYYEHLDDISQSDTTTFTGNMSGMTAGRIARFFNFYGNALVVDTSCSSSLVAIAQACNELILKNADYAVACGVQLWLFPGDRSADPNDIGITSSNGKVEAFSANANGTNNGEAVGSVLLKPMDKAIADKDLIYAVIKGAGVNQDAQRSSFLTAPSSVAQAEAIKIAWRKAGIKPESVTLIEAHGTGTKIGDPIEIKGLELAFASFTQQKQFVALSALKTNIGHTAAAAGISGLIKTVLSLKKKKIFPTLHFNAPNPFIDFKQAPVYINTEFKDWTVRTGDVRRAGVSSFGLTGTNCHILLEEAPEVTKSVQDETSKKYLFTISAKDNDALLANVNTLIPFLEKEKRSLSLEQVSYALNLGKKHYRYRYAVSGNTIEDIVSALKLVSPKENIKYDEVIFLISGRVNVTYQEIIFLAETYPVFNKSFKECMHVLEKKQTDNNVLLFVSQYCLYKLIESKGIKPVNLLGIGAGQLVVAVITGRLKIEDALADLLKLEYSENDLAERLRTYKNKIKGKKIAFVEIGKDGTLSSTLNLIKSTDDTYTTHTIETSSNDTLLEIVRTIYLINYDIDWNAFYDHDIKQKIALPSYQFRKTRCWIKESKEAFVENWLYKLNWEKVETPATSISLKGKRFIVFADGGKIAEGLCKFIASKEGSFIKIYKGDSFRKDNDHEYFLDYKNEQSYVELIESLKTFDITISGLIDLWSCDQLLTNTINTDDFLSEGLYSQFYITKAFDYFISQKDFIFLVASIYGRIITGQEKIFYPHRAASNGYFSSLSLEYQELKVKCVDLDQEAQISEKIQRISEELVGRYDKLVVGYRNNERYLPCIESFIEDKKNTVNLKFQEGGVYLITGGASGIGMEIAIDIVKKYKLKLVIIGRRELVADKNNSWKKLAENTNHPYHSVLKTFSDIEENGSQISYFSVNISNKEELRKVINEVSGSIGTIKGVIHAAGVPGKMRVKNYTIDGFKEAFEPKIHGSINLADLIDTSLLDFFVMFSSHSSILGIARTTNYSAANMFQDNFAYALRKRGVNAISINWPSWKDTGMWNRISDKSENIDGVTQLSNTEGLSAFYQLLRINHFNVIVSKFDPNLLRDNPYFSVKGQVAGSNVNRLFNVSESLGFSNQTNDKNSYKYNPEFTETENKIAEIWQDILKTGGIKPDEDFFELGGHSLNGAQVINRIEKLFSVEMEFEEFFDYSTIRQLAKHVDTMNQRGFGLKKSTIELLPVQDYYEVSHSQERMWFANRMNKNTLAYNMVAAFEITGDLNIVAMEKAFHLIVNRHESLRTTFIELEGELKQKIDLPESICLEIIDCVASPGLESFKQYYSKESTRIFDLEKGPLVFASILKSGPQQNFFLLNIHHINTDGWSMNVLLNELKIAYGSFCENKEPLLSLLQFQYKDFAAWQNFQINNGLISESKKYWEEQFSAPFPSQTIELDNDGDEYLFETKNTSILLDEDITKALKNVLKNEKATLFMGIVSLLNLLLFRYTGRTDIIIGFPVAGRDRDDQENQTGLYVNTLALRNRFDQEDTFLTLLSKVKKVALEGFQHQAYPFDSLLSHLRSAYKSANIQLFNVMLVYQNSHALVGDTTLFGDLEMKWISDSVLEGKFDLTFIVSEEDERLKIEVQYNSSLFKDETILTLINHISSLFALVPDNQTKKIYEFELREKSTENHLSNNITTKFEF